MELNSNQIQEINPHRYPFALVDRITDYKPGEYAKGIKCVSVNEMHFCGHFPSRHARSFDCRSFGTSRMYCYFIKRRK